MRSRTMCSARQVDTDLELFVCGTNEVSTSERSERVELNEVPEVIQINVYIFVRFLHVLYIFSYEIM